MVTAVPITAVMVTGKGIARLPLARAAIASFLAQTYPAKKLLIINDGDYSVLDPAVNYESVEEFRVDGKRPLGELRNIGIRESTDDWIMQWDDDDFSHPERMTYQAGYMRDKHAIILRWQLRYSLTNDSAFLMKWGYPANPGIPGTVLFHKDTSKLYQAVGKKEDEYFLNDHYKSRTTVLHNSPESGRAHYYLRLQHKHNTWDARHIMGNYVNTEYHGRRDLGELEEQFLDSVVANHYLESANI